MSNIPNPRENPDLFRYFVFVVDGEVGHLAIFQNSPEFERATACLLSNPTIIELTGEDRINVDPRGWTFDGTNFIPPSE